MNISENLTSYAYHVKHDFLYKIYFKALIWGSIVDFIFSTMVSIGLGVLFATSIPKDIPPTPELIERLYFTFIHQNPLILLGALLLGLMATGIGSFVTAYIAKDAKMMNGGLIGIMSFISGALFFDSRLPLWYEILALIMVLPVAFGSGYLANKLTKEDGGETKEA